MNLRVNNDLNDKNNQMRLCLFLCHRQKSANDHEERRVFGQFDFWEGNNQIDLSQSFKNFGKRGLTLKVFPQDFEQGQPLRLKLHLWLLILRQ